MLYTAPPRDFEELVERLRKIKDLGYIATHRVGATGIGKTLEDLLGIEENNVPGPNTKLLELKSTRKRSKSMITLITKSPSPEGSNSLLLRRYGYTSSRKGLVLHVTLRKPGEITFVRNKPLLMLRTTEEKIEIVSTSNEVLAYWDAETLRVKFEEKFPALILVKADVRGRGSSEEFWYNEAWLLKGFDYTKMRKLIEEGLIKIDIRIGQYPDGSPHDHGTGFRTYEDKLDLVFKKRERIV